MKTGSAHLFVPGPTNVPDDVRRAMNLPMEDHRAPDFPDLVDGLLADLRPVFGLDHGRVLLYPASGTGAWEAAILNTLDPGERVLMSRYGHFSTLWVDMARALGLDVECVDVPWGTGVPVEEYERRLRTDPSIRAVFVTHNETATGVTSDVAAVRAAMDVAGSDALLFVDGVSSIGSIEFRQDDWRVDVAVAGSQKGLMLPPGLAALGVGERALEAAGAVSRGGGYFGFRAMAAAHDRGSFPYTPPVTLLRGLRAALDRLHEEGLEFVFARHARLAEGVRRGVHAWGLSLCAHHPRWYSDTVSAIEVPPDVDAREVCRVAYERFRTSFGGGLGRLEGRVFRIGHLGDLNEVSCLSALAAAELALTAAGGHIALGEGVAAAQRYYLDPADACASVPRAVS